MGPNMLDSGGFDETAHHHMENALRSIFVFFTPTQPELLVLFLRGAR